MDTRNSKKQLILLMLIGVWSSPVIAHDGHRMDRTVGTTVRNYYIAAEEQIWDFAPSGRNLATQDTGESHMYLEEGPDRLGHKYIKAKFVEYTDGTFSVRKPQPSWLGLLGPVIYMNAGDTVHVHFKNNATRKYTVHAHGVIYTKENEGALYTDNTKASQKKDDGVPPGETYIYTWIADESVLPTEDDPNCLSWAYHSHVITEKDTNAGLIGMILVCKKGIIGADGTRSDVDKDFVLLFKDFDENISWYIDRNAAKLSNKEILLEDEDFQASNVMYGINGYVFGNLPHLEVCEGDKVSWHLFGLGTETDLHTVYFHGQTVLLNHHRTDGVSIFPAEFATVTMVPSGVGKWLINCQTTNHLSAGMTAFLQVKSCGKSISDQSLKGKERQYYIAVHEEDWNYGPSGQDLFNGGSLIEHGSKAEEFFSKSSQRIGGVYKKAIYREYTDASFSVIKARADDELHLGYLGPVIRAEVGDTIKVTLKNNANRDYSIQPQGVKLNKSDEGSSYIDGSTSQKFVKPGAQHTYTWTLPESVGPTSDDPDCLTWIYISGVDPVKDMYSGLVGPLLVCKAGMLDENGKQKNIDKEFILLFSVTDENLSWYLDENLNKCCSSGSVDKDDEEFHESNRMHGINGYVYANLPGLTMCVNDKVSWHVLAVGDDVDLHSVYFHGQTFTRYDTNRDSVSLVPGSTATLKMVPDNAGKWAVVCHSNDHYDEGMVGIFNVKSCDRSVDSTAATDGVTRTYYIAAKEVEWDYAPKNVHIITGTAIDEHGDSEVFVKYGIGKVYKKAVYREYTDSTFKTEKKRSDSEKHLGLLGPFIKAETGDTIKVIFKNMASKPYSIQPHGVRYGKEFEGSSYLDALTNGTVAPNGTYTYTWTVPSRSGPGDGDPNCITSAYSSAVDPVKDTNTGLIGPLIICRKNTLNAELKPKGVDKEFALLFTVTDENESWYLEENKAKYVKQTADVDFDSDEFEESNLMHGINGKVYGNNEGLIMKKNDVVNWYLIGFGTEVDMHNVHFHGQTFIYKKQKRHQKDTIEVFPGKFETIQMKTVNPGPWLVHCHVNDHMTAGMETLYMVETDQRTTDVSAANEVFPSTSVFAMTLLIFTHICL